MEKEVHPMSALILIITFAILFFAGYRFMEHLDHALDNGSLHPYWDSEEEQISKLTLPAQKKAS